MVAASARNKILLRDFVSLKYRACDVIGQAPLIRQCRLAAMSNMLYYMAPNETLFGASHGMTSWAVSCMPRNGFAQKTLATVLQDQTCLQHCSLNQLRRRN
jgi:hypothetical protein